MAGKEPPPSRNLMSKKQYYCEDTYKRPSTSTNSNSNTLKVCMPSSSETFLARRKRRTLSERM